MSGSIKLRRIRLNQLQGQAMIRIIVVVVIFLVCSIQASPLTAVEVLSSKLWTGEAIDKWTSALANIAQVVAIGAAGWYFISKRNAGYDINNLSVTIDCERSKSNTDSDDFLGICIHLVKGEHGTLKLKILRARITYGDGPPIEIESIGHMSRSIVDIPPDRKRFRISAWDSEPTAVSWINITPHEHIDIGAHTRVPNSMACLVEVLIVGTTLKGHVSQWKASRACLPVPEGQLSAVCTSRFTDETPSTDAGKSLLSL